MESFFEARYHFFQVGLKGGFFQVGLKGGKRKPHFLGVRIPSLKQTGLKGQHFGGASLSARKPSGIGFATFA